MRIETDRLLMRFFNEKDIDALFRLDSDPAVMKYIGIPPVTTPQESEIILNNLLRQYEENGVGRLAVIEKSSAQIIGWSGLKLLTEPINGHIDVLDLGYRFMPEYWGKGYAKESGKAAIENAFNTLNINKIFAHAHEGNIASQKVLEKLGFLRTDEFLDHDGVCFWYELEKESTF